MNEEESPVDEDEVERLKRLAIRDFAGFSLAFRELPMNQRLAVLSQVPNLQKLASEAITSISEAYTSMAISNQRGAEHVHRAIQEWRDSLRSMLNLPDLTIDQRMMIIDSIAETAREQRDFHESTVKSNNEAFKIQVLRIASTSLPLLVLAVTSSLSLGASRPKP